MTIVDDADIVATPSGRWYETEDGDQVLLPVHHHTIRIRAWHAEPK